MNLFGRYAPYAKAIVAFLALVVDSILVALIAIGDDATLGDISTVGWFTIAAAILVGTGAVFFVTNSES